MKAPDFSRPGVWQELFAQALRLTDHLSERVRQPTWSFGGGTVLMLRLGHRFSKDIDLFVPDPQYLGYFSPRLTDVAEALTTEYEEAAEYTKLFLPNGEIDIVVGTPLTPHPWDAVVHQGRTIQVESCAEIVAKKMHHRGHLAKARDLFDLCAVADLEPQAIEVARPSFARHGHAFLQRLQDHKDLARDEFAKIDRLGYRPSFDECLARARGLLAG
jgi:hypothetical protein